MTLGAIGRTPLEGLPSVDDDAVVARVIDGWDVDGDRTTASLIDDLDQFRSQAPAEETAELADTIFSAMVDFGEDLPDMYWVHVAVLCRDMLHHGLRP